MTGLKIKFAPTKRQKFVSASIVLSIGVFTLSFLPPEVRPQAIIALAFLSGLWTIWSTWEDLAGIKFLIVPILPTYYSIAFSLFSFLLPPHPLVRFLIACGFGVSFYILSLTQNIFNVSAIRTIQLIRAAHAVGFLFYLVAAYFIFNVIIAFRLPFYLLTVLILLASFPLFLSALWSYELEDFLSRRVVFYAILFAVVLAEVAWVFAFWPLASSMNSLVLVTSFYVLLGIAQAYFEKRLDRRTLYEYIGVSLVVFLIVFATTRWGG